MRRLAVRNHSAGVSGSQPNRLAWVEVRSASHLASRHSPCLMVRVTESRDGARRGTDSFVCVGRPGPVPVLPGCLGSRRQGRSLPGLLNYPPQRLLAAEQWILCRLWVWC